MQLLLIGANGFVGSILRYLIGSQFVGLVVPGGTFVVNVIGCLLMGVAVQIGDSRGWPSRDVQLLVTAGFLGGFTTFSAFGHEAVELLRISPVKGLVYPIIHVVSGIAAVAAGRAATALVLRAG